ncbi:tRNA (adenosine(37)-N6)-threonylcarbamoyltransferase complex dimerization subunit type 1 TsaB [Allosphingosinicella indica]|uniref:tRNA threonylcarbamoyl adenosine modification protein YeaZ n=1 Tax=Allosphingosinicella indica TaxID=941907 RepID=A0A1X7GAK5_9SPHN|nr:tRNA (adenosine(37)-N6)-threonylcarbamoyltransferase complex dimerization subunit type 1 TsaB [Allosphingosinicella indica]SMF66352.1 tRNA threonylcarbamoyl adenosine modification protein YeaZ [Allosphingosinicella indica]
MILAISSSTAACSAALIQRGDLIDERHELVGRGHAEWLMPMIADLLAGRRPDAIIVDCGPGSFTGVRVGLSAAHGLAIGWGVPLNGCSSTALLAAAADAEGEIGVALIGGHGELFVQNFSHDPLSPLDALRSLAPQAAAAAIGAEAVTGSAAEELVALRGFGRAIAALPRAADARLLPDELASLPPTPLYGRAPDAKPA